MGNPLGHFNISPEVIRLAALLVRELLAWRRGAGRSTEAAE